MSIKPTLATASEVAEFLRTSPAKLANDRSRGVGVPFVKYGHRVLYRWEDVHAYVQANILQRTDGRPVGVA
ncbi:helix-turn-helix domain-containing protein [Mycobacterium sp. NPDC050041]|uniref:helix-turn-helix domain-containing protein n=1 Tax=Mycobacterium sp. NPDC050041 TaxID=3364293 RepID=UPI003C2FA55C